MLLLRLALHQAIGWQAAFLLFVLAVMAAAWFGGLGPGLLATALSLLFAVIVIALPPLRVDSLAQGLNAILFLIVGTTISVLCEALHAARQRDTERQFRTLADSIPQLVWMAHSDGSRFWFNKRWYEYTGTVPDQMIGWGWLSVYDAAERCKVQESWQAAIAKGQPWEEILPLRRHDGRLFWHLARAAPLRNSSGEILTWFGTSTDISERLEIERALQEADQHKNHFLAAVAHELRNPLAALNNSLILWSLVENDKTETQELRAAMTRQVKQMHRMIEDLLDVARISHGKVSLVPRPLNLNEVISGAIDTVRPLIDSYRQQLDGGGTSRPSRYS